MGVEEDTALNDHFPLQVEALDKPSGLSGPVSSPVQFNSEARSCPALCDPMDCSTPGLPVHHQLPEFTH